MILPDDVLCFDASFLEAETAIVRAEDMAFRQGRKGQQVAVILDAEQLRDIVIAYQIVSRIGIRRA